MKRCNYDTNYLFIYYLRDVTTPPLNINHDWCNKPHIPYATGGEGSRGVYLPRGSASLPLQAVSSSSRPGWLGWGLYPNPIKISYRNQRQKE